MSSQLMISVSDWTSSLLGVSCVLMSFSIDRCNAAYAGRDQKGGLLFRHEQSFQEEFPWLATEDDEEILEGELHPQSRVRRSANESSGSKNVWQKIEEFYSDDNNMAMFCVLPIMILIYGGCSSIYCIYKCRQYLKRSKHKRLKEEDCESLNSESQRSDKLNDDKNRPVSQISQAWADLHVDPSEKRWSGQTEGVGPGYSSPLPWQAPSKASVAAALALYERDEMQLNMPGNKSCNLLKQVGELPGPNINSGMINNGDKRSGIHDDKLRDTTIGLNDKKKLFDKQLADAHKHPDIQAATDVPNRQPPQPPAAVRAVDPRSLGAARADANMADYATNRSSAAKATDFSRFSDSRPIEIIPLSADPNLRVWDPLHNRPFGNNASHDRGKPGASGNRPESVQAMKEEILARYDALSTLQMARRAAEILSTNAVEKNPFQRKPGKKKHIFIAE